MKAKTDFRLYVITGENYHPGRAMLDVMEAAIRGGADIVQLRDKETPPGGLLEKARALRALTRRYRVPFIVNDHVELAREAEADGVHLGQDDMPIAQARALLGTDAIIGRSTHAIEQARAAVREGADYLGVGPVYPTGTKPGRAAVTTSYVREAAAEITIPWVAIGGITPDNADDVLAAGARRLCAVSAVVGSADPEAAARDLKSRIEAWTEPAAARTAPNVPITIKLNGRTEMTSAATVAALIEGHGLTGRRIVAEVDGEIVERAAWARTMLRDGARVELVHFVGGG